MTIIHKIGLAFLIVVVAGLGGYWQGRNSAKEAALKAAVQAYQTRNEINDKVTNMGGASLCVALGGLRGECAALMRGVGAPAKDK